MRVRLRVGYVGWTHSATSPKCPTRQARNPLTRESLRARRAPGALGLRARRSPQARQPASRQPAGSPYLTRYFASVAFSFSISIGLDRWSFMPDSLARATSSMKALAVMAMMGTSAASGLSHRRMARVAS